MKRLLAVLLTLSLLTLVPLASLAEANVALNPDDSWWGMSRTKFKETFGDVSFEEVTVDRHKALALRAVDIGSLTVDVYFDFAQREAGKSYYTLSKVAYIVPLENRKFSSNALSRTYNTLVDIVTAENGKRQQVRHLELHRLQHHRQPRRLQGLQRLQLGHGRRRVRAERRGGRLPHRGAEDLHRLLRPRRQERFPHRDAQRRVQG